MAFGEDVTGWLSFEGRRVGYRRAGAGDAILFVPDHILTARLWDLQVERFRSGHDVVVADLPGFGRSDPLPGVDLSLVFFVRWLERVVDELELAPVAIVGHGLGSLAALHYGADHARDVRALVLVHTVTDTTDRAAARQFGAQHPAARHARSVRRPSDETAPAGVRGRWGAVARRRRSSRRAQFAQHVLERFAEPQTRLAMLNVSRHARTWVLPHPSRLARRPPICWLWGDCNRLQPLGSGLPQLDALEPDEVHILTGCGYAAPWEQPHTLNRLIERFLARHPSRAADRGGLSRA